MPSRSHRTYPSRQVYAAVAAVSTVVAVVLWYFAIRNNTIHVSSTTLVVGGMILVAAFIASETLPLRVEWKRETFLVSLSELSTNFRLGS